MGSSLGRVRARSRRHARTSGARTLAGRGARRAGWTAFTALCLLLTVVALPPSAQAGAFGVTNPTRVATDLSEDVCAQLGRAWATVDGLTGCSRSRCARPDARMSGDYNAEACTLGGKFYGANLESQTCRALHRSWIPQVNRCLGNVDSPAVDGVVLEASQCDVGYSTYVRLPGRLGQDICVRPESGQRYVEQARQRATSVAVAAFSDSRVLCAQAANYEWDRGACRRLGRGESKRRPATRVLVIGDSVTWRAADEMTATGRGWVVDGRPGTTATSFDRRYADALALRRAPRTLVFALGTNNEDHLTRAGFERKMALAPRRSKVVLVTPYRSAKVYGRERAKFMKKTARWFEQIARDRPRTCVADWQGTASRRPDLTIDGVHQTARGEQVFAGLVAQTVARCR